MTHLHKHLHAKPKKDWLDYLLYFFMVATPLFELPQAVAIYTTHSAGSVSPVTWGFFVLADVAWLTYAVRNKLVPLVVTYSLFLLIELSIVLGVFIYPA